MERKNYFNGLFAVRKNFECGLSFYWIFLYNVSQNGRKLL